MKKLSVLVLVLASVLSACQAEKSPEDSSIAATTDNTVPVVAATSTETTTATATATATATSEGESENLHTKNCTRCHSSDVYTRTDRKVTSLDALGKQVRMCNNQLETQLFPEDMEKLTHYLNQTYYKF